jgi:6-pyruvoyltetrahydropterin/6-carboxytetrahydropterin synthase
MTYRSTKTYDHSTGFSCAFRQWRADSHCRLVHGYALAFRFEFEAATLDARNWVMDFGGLKELKDRLTYWFDHTTVVADDDPLRAEFIRLHNYGAVDMRTMENVGCEAFAAFAHRLARDAVVAAGQEGRVRVVSAEVREHGANSAIYIEDLTT